SVTTILAIRVGSSAVSAMTQTPASGPFGPETTPPRSVAPIDGAVDCCANSCAGEQIRASASAAAATLEYKVFVALIVFSSVFLSARAAPIRFEWQGNSTCGPAWRFRSAAVDRLPAFCERAGEDQFSGSETMTKHRGLSCLGVAVFGLTFSALT